MQTEHNSTHLVVILEIAAHPDKRREHDRFTGIIETLKRSSVGAFPISHVHCCQGQHYDPILVPGFGHSIRCDQTPDNKHVCDVQTWGVLRYFNVHLYVEGLPGVDILGEYAVNHPSIARMDVCGLYGRSEAGEERTNLEWIIKKTEATNAKS